VVYGEVQNNAAEIEDQAFDRRNEHVLLCLSMRQNSASI